MGQLVYGGGGATIGMDDRHLSAVSVEVGALLADSQEPLWIVGFGAAEGSYRLLVGPSTPLAFFYESTRETELSDADIEHVHGHLEQVRDVRTVLVAGILPEDVTAADGD